MAISAIDLSMMTVETGSSSGSVARPNAPPAAPEAMAATLCRLLDGPRRVPSQCPQGHGQSKLQPFFSRRGNGLGGGRRQCIANGIEWLSHHGGQTRSKARIFQQSNRGPQRCRIVRRYECSVHPLRYRYSAFEAQAKETKWGCVISHGRDRAAAARFNPKQTRLTTACDQTTAICWSCCWCI